jgi:hypothetical protein
MVVRGFSNVRSLRKIKMLKQVQHDGGDVERQCLLPILATVSSHSIVTLSSPTSSTSLAPPRQLLFARFVTPLLPLFVTLNLFQGLNSGPSKKK